MPETTSPPKLDFLRYHWKCSNCLCWVRFAADDLPRLTIYRNVLIGDASTKANAIESIEGPCPSCQREMTFVSP